MIFEVTPEQIELLSDTDLRTLVGRLAEQEAVRAGHSAACVTYGGHQNAKDGGIDVRVDTSGGAITGYIPRSSTGIQVKAEDMPKSKILDEMRPKGTLRPAIRMLGEAGGAYVIVSSKGSTADPALSARGNAMAEAMADAPTADGIHLDFYDRQRVASWVNQHPGLVPWVRSRIGQPLSGWQPFDDWSSSPGTPDEAYLIDESVRLVGTRIKDNAGLNAENGINHLRQLLAQPKGIVRLVGLSGVGKTRLVQALFDHSLGVDPLSPHLAVYTDLSDEPEPVPLELLSRLNGLRQRCVLIVDNCGVELHQKLAARTKRRNSLVSIITVEYDVSDDEPENTGVFKLEPASSDLIEKILQRRYPQLTAPEIRTIAEFSEGNSRIALALAETAQDGESLASLRDSELFKRLFQQKHEDNPALLRAAKACSLVYSFDGETLGGEDAELPLLASLAEQTPSELHGHIAELQRRQLVQKRSIWRAFLPHALAHRLAKSALQDIPIRTLQDHFTNQAPERLVKSFSRRLGDLHDSPEAQAIAAEWLRKDGWLSEIENLSELGIAVFDHIAPISPGAVLKSIKEAANRESDFFDVGRPNNATIIRILRALAYDPDLFNEAVTLIGRFAQTFDSSNNLGEAANVFSSLFLIHLSGTHAPVSQRVEFIRELAASENERDQKLVIEAIEALLRCGHLTSSYSFEFGTRKRDYGFLPKTPAEIKDWFRTVFRLCSDLVKMRGYREPIRSLVAENFRELSSETGAVDDLIALAEEFEKDGGWPQGWVGVRGAIRAAKEAKRGQDLEKLAALAGRLKPSSLGERIESYVAPKQWNALDVAELEFDDEKRYEKARNQVEIICQGIGEELANDLEALVTHLPAILSADIKKRWIVGCAIGSNVADPTSAWDILLSTALFLSADNHSASFLSAFLSGLAEKDRSKAETLLDSALKDEPLHPYLVRMQCAVGLDERGCARLMEAVKLKTVPSWTFRNLGYCGVSNEVPGPRFHDLVVAIGERDDGLDSAFYVLYMRLFSRRENNLRIEPDDRKAGRHLLSLVRFEDNGQREGSELATIARDCLVSPGDHAVALQLCRRFCDGVAQCKVHGWHYTDLISALGRLFPRAVLDVLVEGDKPESPRPRYIFGLFRENDSCPLDAIDDTTLLDWAREKPATRFLQLAEVVRPWEVVHSEDTPPIDVGEETNSLTWRPVAISLVREAPDSLAVLSEFVRRFQPWGWSGSLADILSKRLPLLEQFQDDPDPDIAGWVGKSIEEFKAKIESRRQWEADRDRERDERFEW